MKEFEDWKGEEIKTIKNDIEYHERKLRELKMKLNIFEA